MATTNIQVAVRVRPFLPFEAGSKSCIDVLPGVGNGGGEEEYHGEPRRQPLSRGRSVRIGSSAANRDAHTFTFDRCFGGSATQAEVYDDLIQPLLSSCLEGYNATALAYGQTGAGKTYTTLGPATVAPDFFATQNSDHKHGYEYDAVGILPRALRDLFVQLEQKRRLLNGEIADDDPVDPADDVNNVDGDSTHSSEIGLGIKATKSPKPKKRPTNNGTVNNSDHEHRTRRPFEYQVKLQFLELYGEEIRDLLTTPSSSSSQLPKIVIRDSSGGDAEALGATSVPVSTAQEAMVCLTRGMLRRVTGATAMNAESSRSHAIMSVMIEQVTRSSGDGEDGGGFEESVVVLRKSKFNFVDLAGSERSKRTNAKGQRLREGININKGLLVLGNVISALATGDSKFVPFRDSKLTRLLRGSLGGNHKTLMIACASPSLKNAEESLNCLRYANRAKNIQNSVTLNVDPHSKLVDVLRGQVMALAGELLRISNRGGGKVDTDRFTLDLLEALVKGGNSAQTIIIGKTGNALESSANSSESKPLMVTAYDDAEITSAENLPAELEKARRALKETQCDLLDKSEQLEAIVSERDSLRRKISQLPFTIAATPSKEKGSTGDESIRDILATLSTEDDDGSHAIRLSYDANEEEDKKTSNDVPALTPRRVTGHVEEDLKGIQNKELSPEVERLHCSLDRITKELHAKSDELEAALDNNRSLREIIRDTPDVDEETIHFIVKHIASFDDRRIEECEDDVSLASSYSNGSEDQVERQSNEELSNFASAMFSTGKFLVDRELYEESIACFETVVEVRRELYGWDDPLVGDSLHMEGFARTKMGDYDRALMLLWDALRIRKIASEPLKISATLRLLADLHFSKEENMHAALFYEECARHLKEHDMSDPHLPLVLIDLARTKDRLGEYDESMNFFEEALGLYGRSLDHDDDRIASLQYEMGVLAFQMGERVRGEQCFRHFIRIRKSKGSRMDEGVANALFVLGSLHWATKKRDHAQDCWQEALDIFKGLGRTDDDPYVKSLKDKLHRAQRRPITRMFRGS